MVKLDAQKNIVYVGTKEDLLSTELSLHDVKFQYPFEKEEFEANVKIRYNMDSKPARIFVDYKNMTGRVVFDEPVASVTSGQAAVFYDKNDKHLIGGGWID